MFVAFEWFRVVILSFKPNISSRFSFLLGAVAYSLASVVLIISMVQEGTIAEQGDPDKSEQAKNFVLVVMSIVLAFFGCTTLTAMIVLARTAASSGKSDIIKVVRSLLKWIVLQLAVNTWNVVEYAYQLEWCIDRTAGWSYFLMGSQYTSILLQQYVEIGTFWPKPSSSSSSSSSSAGKTELQTVNEASTSRAGLGHRKARR